MFYGGYEIRSSPEAWPRATTWVTRLLRRIKPFGSSRWRNVPVSPPFIQPSADVGLQDSLLLRASQNHLKITWGQILDRERSAPEPSAVASSMPGLVIAITDRNGGCGIERGLVRWVAKLRPTDAGSMAQVWRLFPGTSPSQEESCQLIRCRHFLPTISAGRS
jgi:hypothetical protein